MKIAVYTVCKNEEQFVSRWLESCLDADYILVTDTGSTDGTLKELSKYDRLYPHFHHNSVTISPWRFDDARNFSLWSLPTDIDLCISLDMDEILTEGWKQKLQAIQEQVDRVKYGYIWNFNDDGSPGTTFLSDKIHARHGMRWVNPVHEIITKDSRGEAEKQIIIEDVLIEHHADKTKSRGQYLGLLALAAFERPHDDRSAHYYARELMFYQYYEDAIKEFDRHLNLPTATWKSERAASFRYMGDCYWALGKVESAIACFKKAVLEAPEEREAYVSIAQAHRALGNWDSVVIYANKALTIKERPNSYISQSYAWSNWPKEMLDEATKKVNSF